VAGSGLIRWTRCGGGEMDISVTLLAFSVALLVFRRAASDIWNEIVSHRPGWRLAALLVLIVLLFARDPELRVLLFFVDYIGVDIFLILLFFQGREMLVWSGTALWQPTMRFLEVWSWFPMPLPGPSRLRQHPGWSLLAVAQAVVTLTGVFIVAIVAVSIPRAIAAENLPVESAFERPLPWGD